MNSNFALSECPLFIISVFLFNCMIFYYTANLDKQKMCNKVNLKLIEKTVSNI